MWAWKILYAWVSEEPTESEADGCARWEQCIRQWEMLHLWAKLYPESGNLVILSLGR